MSERNEPSRFKRKLVPAGDAKKAAGITGNAFRRIFTAVHSEREESFSDAAERLNWTEDDIAGFMRYRKKEVGIYLVLTGVAFLFACSAPYSNNPISHFITSLAVMLMIATRLMVAHFRLTQIRDRALYSFAEYVGILFPFLASSMREISEGLADDTNATDANDPAGSKKVVDLKPPRD